MGKKYVADVFETTAGKNLDTGKVDVSNNNTGSVIDLGNQSVNYYNMDESDNHSFTTYTLTNIVNGGKSRLLVNTPTLPTITGATNIKGDDFQPDTDIYLEVENSGGRIEYWVKQIYISPFADLESLPFGISVAETTNASTIFLGSPCILKTSTGRYIVSHDYYGSGSTSSTSGVTSVYYTDSVLESNNFTKSADISDMFWASLFEYGGDVYLLGTSKNNGNITISKSTDDGETWITVITVLTAISGSYIGWTKSPNNVIFKDGFLVTAIEAVTTSPSFSSSFKACLVFANLTDLMNPSNWTYSSPVSLNTTTFVNSEVYSNTTQTKYPPAGGQAVTKGFLEGSLVELDGGDLRLFMRLEQTPNANHAVYMDVTWVSANPPTSTLSATQNIVKLHGGNVKFQITYDSLFNKHYAITNVNRFKSFADGRIEAYLISSSDGGVSWDILKRVSGWIPSINWETEILQYGTQYASFIIDGDDIIFASRTSTESANDWHDADKTTLSKIANFRSLTPESFINGSLIIDENSSRLEDVNGISIIHDQSINFNSPYMRVADNANKVFWTSGRLNFTGSQFMRVPHHELLNPTNGFSVFCVIDDLQNTSGFRILSKSEGTPGATDINAKDWTFSAQGLSIGNCYISSDYTDVTIGQKYIIASSYDRISNQIWEYKNGTNRGAPPAISGGTWSVDHINKTDAFTGGNFGELFIGKRNFGSSLFISSKIKAIHIIPEFKNSTDMIAYMGSLNAIYGIY